MISARQLSPLEALLAHWWREGERDVSVEDLREEADGTCRSEDLNHPREDDCQYGCEEEIHRDRQRHADLCSSSAFHHLRQVTHVDMTHHDGTVGKPLPNT